jgi:hypothetical protein
MDLLFKDDTEKKKPNLVKEYLSEQPKLFDLLKYEGGAFYLTRDGKKCHILVTSKYISTFESMYKRNLLTNKALELAKELFGGKDGNKKRSR